MNSALNDVVNEFISSKYTLVERERFDMIDRHYPIINEILGDVVECGVWRGGMSMFLTSLFSEKTIWMVDSFSGFQDPRTGKYQYPLEVHYTGKLSVSIDEVKQNLVKFGYDDTSRIQFLPGYVKDTLQPEVCPISDIALLRIDVDAYSATLEVLDYLYPKVSPGGYIIFDDSCLATATAAMHDYYIRNNIPLKLYDVVTDELLPNGRSTYPCGCYTIKEG